MASKLRFYSALAEQKAGEITATRGNWTAFLDTAARLYKYTYPEQLMIFAQRPDAVSCASIEDWNNVNNRKDFDGKPWRRFVRRGSKGIALIDDTGNYPRLKYVFDISDTETSRLNNPRPFIWQMCMEHEAPVMDALARAYENVSGDFGWSLYSVARQLSDDYYDVSSSPKS